MTNCRIKYYAVKVQIDLFVIMHKITACIRDGVVQYEQDSDRLREAQENVQQAMSDLEKYNLQSQIDDLTDAMDDLADSYQDQLDLLDDQIEKWEKIADYAQSIQDNELASQYLGEDWVVRVITGDDDEIFESFKELYVQNSEQLAQYEKQITTTENINNLLNEYITAYEEESITYEEALAAIESLLDQMNSDMTTGQNLQNVLDYMALMHDTEATVEDVLVGLQNSLDEYSEKLIEGIQQNYENGLAIADVRTTWDVLTDNVQDIRDYAEEILDAIEGLDFSSYYKSDDDYTSSATYSGTNSSAGNIYVDDVKGDVYVTDKVRESYASTQSGPAYAEGLEKGVIGDTDDKENASIIQTLGTTDLDSDEVPIIAHEGELVMNQEQQSQLLKNIHTLSNPLASLKGAPILAPLAGATNSVDVSIGDIILPDVTDPDGFARAMTNQIQSAMRTAISDIRL